MGVNRAIYGGGYNNAGRGRRFGYNTCVGRSCCCGDCGPTPQPAGVVVMPSPAPTTPVVASPMTAPSPAQSPAGKK
uniref:Uncharacterized protein n=1 Tax=Panagrolaimus sp. JU765 TaxID=591449 RepID=A0AC34R1N1_9BILA